MQCMFWQSSWPSFSHWHHHQWLALKRKYRAWSSLSRLQRQFGYVQNRCQYGSCVSYPRGKVAYHKTFKNIRLNFKRSLTPSKGSRYCSSGGCCDYGHVCQLTLLSRWTSPAVVHNLSTLSQTLANLAFPQPVMLAYIFSTLSQQLAVCDQYRHNKRPLPGSTRVPFCGVHVMCRGGSIPMLDPPWSRLTLKLHMKSSCAVSWELVCLGLTWPRSPMICIVELIRQASQRLPADRSTWWANVRAKETIAIPRAYLHGLACWARTTIQTASGSAMQISLRPRFWCNHWHHYSWLTSVCV